MWIATFEDHPPLSGESVEQTYSAEVAESSRWVWVKFASDTGDVWFGCFRSGRVAAWQELATPDGRHVFAIVGGVCYCVDAETKQLRIACGTSFTGLLAIPGTATVAVASLTAVQILSAEAPLGSTSRIAWDGIRLLHASATELHGIAQTGHGPRGDRPFTVDLPSLAVSGGYASDFVTQSSRSSMSAPQPTASFLIKSYFEVTGRGVFMAGDILAGKIKIGDRVVASALPLTINAVEFIDYTLEKRFEICLQFQERPSRAELEKVFPAGSSIEIVAAA